LVRVGLRLILESTEDLVVVGEAEDGAEAVEAVQRCRPDVVLMDIRMPRLDGLAAMAAIRRLPAPPRVLILTTFDLDDHVFRALEAGADGFLLKDTPPRDLQQAVRVVAAGDAMLSPSITRRLIGHMAETSRAATNGRAPEAALATLSPREREVLVEVGRGASNAEVGATLFMSEATVKAHVTHLLAKLGRSNRVQLAIVAHDAGLV
jgi:DNA-binding NarL/FixJ family response regulator